MNVARQHSPDAAVLADREWAVPEDRLAAVLRAYERHALTCEAFYGITSNERRLLDSLDAPTTSDDLVAATGMDDGSVAGTLAILQQAGFVDLEWSRGVDDECSRVTPTPRGLQVASGMKATLAEAMRAEQLDLARAELRRSDEAAAELLAMASHELRTPIATISGFTATMIDMGHKLDESQKRECLAIIDTQSARLRRLVDDLHLYSRVESGRVPVHAEDVDTLVAIRQAIQDRGAANVRVSCSPKLIARADLDHLQQILANYISNALKYGAAPVTIEAQRAGASIVIAVCDRGRGVAEYFVPKLFERFQRGAHQSEVAGSGLGLSIVRGLARAQGGDAWYEPNAPGGSRFCVRLPQGVSR